MPALAALTWAGKRVVWLAPPHLPYAPALAAAGINLSQLVVVRAPGRRDALWAAEQALRAGCCHALLGWFRRASYDDLRRLAVAAEGSAAWIALFRPREAAAESSPACLRLALETDDAPEGDLLTVRILKRRGLPAAAPLRLAVKDLSMLWLALHFPALPPDALAPIAAWACQFTPRVSLEPPQELLLEVQGSLRLYGGLESLHERLPRAARARLPGEHRAAPTPRAALWLSRGAGEAFEALPVEVTQLDVEFFRSIGVSTVGELLQLPRDGLAQRCGAQVARALDRALGALPGAASVFRAAAALFRQARAAGRGEPCRSAALRRPPPAGPARGLARRAAGRHPRLRAGAVA